MRKAKDMLLADALETAINATKENIKLKRIVLILMALCGFLLIVCGKKE